MADQQRKLTTIMSVDVAGYSHTAEHDEAKALEAVSALRRIIDAVVVPLGGRVFNTAGDGFMIELPTASAGVEAASQVLAAPNAPLVRIGLHLGEVTVTETGDLLGHGVNVAARLQAMAEPGSAIVSQAVQAQIHGGQIKLRPLGRVQLDKMHERLDVFAMNGAGGAKSFRRVFWRRARRVIAALVVLGVLGAASYAAWRIYGAQQTAETPRLAVLRFETLGETQPHFTETLADDLIANALRVEGLEVIARASSFALEGANATPAGAAREFNATIVLTGSVSRIEDQVRVVAHLTEARTGRQIWSEQFVRPLSEIYILQNQIAVRVVQAVGLRAIPHAGERVDPQAYEFYLRGRELALQPATAVPLFEAAVARDPEFAAAWAHLGSARSGAARRRWATASPDTVIDGSWFTEAFAALDRAIALDPDAPLPYQVRSSSYAVIGQWREALDAANEAAERGGTTVSVYAMLGYTRRAKAGARDRASLDPLNAVWWFSLGHYCKFDRDLACAIDAYERDFRLDPDQPPYYLALTLHRDGRSAEALALTRTNEVYWREFFGSPAAAPLSMELFRALLGEGEIPSTPDLLATLDAGAYPENLLDVFTEADRGADAALMLPRWSTASRPSLQYLFDYRLAPMRARPEFWDLMEREGILDVWREVGPPDFCEREPVCEPYLRR